MIYNAINFDLSWNNSAGSELDGLHDHHQRPSSALPTATSPTLSGSGGAYVAKSNYGNNIGTCLSFNGGILDGPAYFVDTTSTARS